MSSNIASKRSKQVWLLPATNVIGLFPTSHENLYRIHFINVELAIAEQTNLIR